MWPDHRIQDLLGIALPIVQAPMAGAQDAELAIAVAQAGGLGSLPCAMLSAVQVRQQVHSMRQTAAPAVNLNFFCHHVPDFDAARDARWRQQLAPYYREFGVDPAPVAAGNRAPFDHTFCELVEELKPEVVSFHFGLPEAVLLDRVIASGAKILSSATTVTEARWLEARGCDAIIAQGAEAGGHRATFLNGETATQIGTFALVPQIVDAVKVPVIASGGIADARGIVAAFALGAAAVQIGTAYLFGPEARISPVHRAALARARDDETAITNLFSGRPARGIVNRLMRELGPIGDQVPAFPFAGSALMPLRTKTEPSGSGDFISLWSGQAARLAQAMPAAELTRKLAADALALMTR